MSYEKVLSNLQLDVLRRKSIISENEIAVQAGDLLYAKNIISEQKRILNINISEILNGFDNVSETKQDPSTRKILKG